MAGSFPGGKQADGSPRPSVTREARGSISSLEKVAWTEAYHMLQMWLFIMDFPWSKGLWDCQRGAHPGDEGQKLGDRGHYIRTLRQVTRTWVGTQLQNSVANVFPRKKGFGGPGEHLFSTHCLVWCMQRTHSLSGSFKNTSLSLAKHLSN